MQAEKVDTTTSIEDIFITPIDYKLIY